MYGQLLIDSVGTDISAWIIDLMNRSYICESSDLFVLFHDECSDMVHLRCLSPLGGCIRISSAGLDFEGRSL